MACGKIRVVVRGTLPGYHPGQVVELATDEAGTPLEHYWRRRLRDAASDGGSVEILPDEQPEPRARGGRRT